MIAPSTVILISLLGLSSAVANHELNRSKRQFLEVDSGDFVNQPLYRYRSAAAVDPYYSGATTLVAAAPRPVYYQRPVYQRVEYVPVRSYYRPRVVVERPITTVIERPARVLALQRPATYVEFEKRRRMRMMAKQ